MRLIYNLFIRLYGMGAVLSARFNPKARQWVSGRRDQKALLRRASSKSNHWIWFHASSLGEFEQGRPVIEAIRQQQPGYQILLTFFSPSGYEIRKNYEHADCVAYLPADTPSNARAFVKLFNPRAAFFIKYEFWFNYMKALQDEQIPLYFISARFRKTQHFFSFYGFWFRKQLGWVTHFFVQDSESAQLLQKAGIHQCTLTGDTRFDRVARLATTARHFPDIVQFKGNRKLLIAGSTWPPDEKLLSSLLIELPENWTIIMAPHDVGKAHISELSGSIPLQHQLYSRFDPKTPSRVLIIDSIGILSQIYQYADFVYIGGGFGQSIHNIQEPVTFGCPVIFGPKYHKFSEAVDLISLGGAFAVHNETELIDTSKKLMNDEAFRKTCSAVCKNYVSAQTGATEKIMDYLQKNLFN